MHCPGFHDPAILGYGIVPAADGITVLDTASVIAKKVNYDTSLFTGDNLFVVYTTNGSEVLGVDNTSYLLTAGQSLDLTWVYTPEIAKLTTITATVIVELEGKEYTFSTSIELDVQDASRITYVGVDASHNNEYRYINHSYHPIPL